MFMTEDVHVGKLTEEEIKALANNRAEKEAFVKSTVVFVLVWVAGFLIIPFLQERSYRVLGFIVSVRTLCVVVSFFAAFFAGLVTRWIVKESAYEKYYTLYKEQQKQEQSR
jgi:cell division protein FtsW (lipid II flippase)